MISALVAYADQLGVLVCAEGVEQQQDLDHLRTLGIGCAQGFLLGKPDTAWAADIVAVPVRREMHKPHTR